MPPTSTKTLSPAELAKLEHAFATDPASDAYKPLAEAYLGMGRFMEAMVVCKKGVKAHPNAADPRLLLARVYADQGKDRKALEEVQGALQIAPNDKVALRMAGVLHFKLGEAEPGKTNLLKAFAADPGDEATLTALRENKVDAPSGGAAAAPAAAESAPAAPAGAAPIAGPGTARPGARAEDSGAPRERVSGVLSPVQLPSEQVATHHPHSNGNGASRAPAARASGTVRPVPSRPSRTTPAIRHDDDDQEEVRSESVDFSRRSKNAGTKKLFFALLMVMPVVLGLYLGVGRYQAKQKRELNKHLSEVSEQLHRDSYDSYKKACAAAEQALEVDGDSGMAHAYLAYAYAIRWGEHGGGDEARKRAEQHLAEARDNDGDISYVASADALLQTYSGKGAQARGALEQTLKKLEADGRPSALLFLTLGILQMNGGDLEGARESLQRASGLANDARIFAAMGTLYRRRGQEREARLNFIHALRYERDHHESLLGQSLLMLDQDEPDFAIAAAMLKKLVEGEPPPSPRQLAAAHLARSFLVSRVSKDLPLYKSADYQKELSAKTGVPMDPQKARAELQRSEETGFSLDRQNPELHLIKGRRLLSEGQVDQAVTEIRRAIQMDSTRALFYVDLARALMAKPGGEKEAADALTTVIKSMGESPKLVVMLGDAYRRQGKLDDAISQYTRVLKEPGSKNPEARMALGRIYRERKDWSRASEHFDKAAQEFVGQPSRIAEAYTELGRTVEEKGDRERSEEFYQKALNADVDYTPSYCFYARMLSQDRKSERKAREVALEYLKRDKNGECAADAQRIASN